MENEKTENVIENEKSGWAELPPDLAAIAKKGRKHQSMYPFASMKVGKFELLDPNENESLEDAHKRIQSAVGAFRRNAKQTSFQVRIAEERGKIFVRRIDDRPSKIENSSTESK
jgi:hypothetical protein